MKYTFEKLQKHTKLIRSDSKPLILKNKIALDGAFALFSEYFQELEESPKSISKNVKMLLTTRFMNHLYSYFLLVESGMVSDSITCERSAIEVLAAYKCDPPDK